MRAHVHITHACATCLQELICARTSEEGEQKARTHARESACKRESGPTFFSSRIPLLSSLTQAKHVGTGSADTTRFEWAVNMHRDTAASLVGHHYLTAYLAVAENEAPAVTPPQA